MSRSEKIRRLVTLAPSMALLLGIGCGGGDKGPTGPGGGNGGAGTYDLAAVSGIELPADVQVEDCIPSRFHRGRLVLNEDGAWHLALEFSDDNYDHRTVEDEGEFEHDGATVWLSSIYTEFTYLGTLGDGGVSLSYDWCYNDVADVQLVFDR